MGKQFQKMRRRLTVTGASENIDGVQKLGVTESQELKKHKKKIKVRTKTKKTFSSFMDFFVFVFLLGFLFCLLFVLVLFLENP